MLIGGLGDLGLDVTILEHRFDDDVATLEVTVVFARVDTAQDPLDAVGGRPPFLEAAFECLADFLFAPLCAGEVPVEQNDVDADLGGYVRDPLPHQACANDAHLLHVEPRHILRPAGALLALLKAEEQSPQHGAGGRVLKHANELTRLHLAGAIHRKTEAVVDRLQDRPLRGHIAVGVRVGHRVRAHHRLGERDGVGAAAGHLVALLIPALRRVAVLVDPLLGSGDQVLRFDELVDQALLERLVGSELLSLHNQAERTLDADQSR